MFSIMTRYRLEKEIFRISVGLSILLAHGLCFLVIFMWKGEYLSEQQQISIALLMCPITAAYITAVIRSAIERSSETARPQFVNLNYALVVFLFTLMTLGGLVFTVMFLDGAQESDKQKILIFEIAFGAGFGLIVADLFGKVESS
ncbi:hypothetical protein LPLAFNJD_LOCUS2342 [Methylorubrum aminovorans]